MANSKSYSDILVRITRAKALIKDVRSVVGSVMQAVKELDQEISSLSGDLSKLAESNQAETPARADVTVEAAVKEKPKPPPPKRLPALRKDKMYRKLPESAFKPEQNEMAAKIYDCITAEGGSLPPDVIAFRIGKADDTKAVQDVNFLCSNHPWFEVTAQGDVEIAR